MSVAEFISIQALLNVDAFKNTILAKYSYVWLVSASSTSTPLAFLVSLSYEIFVTIDQGRTVKLPVALAAGKVDDCVLKSAPNGQPSQHLLRYWQLVRPGSRWVILAVR